MPILERRMLPFSGAVELHDGKTIRGFAAVYYDGTPSTEYSLGGNIIERIHPGAFAGVLESRADVLALYHHDEAQLLGRRAAGTLTLEDSQRGLSYSVKFDESDPVHQSVASRIRRGDVQGSSFGFRVGEERIERRSDGKAIRNIHSFAAVPDVGPTHLPAYAGTTAEVRAHVERMLGIEPPTPVEFWART